MTTNDLDQNPGTELCTTATPPTLLTSTRTDRGPGMHWSFRTDRRVVWVGYHLPELVAVIVPAVLAVTWHWVFLVLSAGFAALWTGHEHRRRHRDDDKLGSARPAALTPNQADGTHTASSDEEATRGQLA